MTEIATPIIATKAKTAKTNEIAKTILVGAFRFIILFYFVQLVAVAKLSYHFFCIVEYFSVFVIPFKPAILVEAWR
jgi:hypothetical protein